MTAPDPFAEVRAEFVAGLGRRVETMHQALAQLEACFDPAAAQTLYRAAHSLNGTAGSFGVEDLADAAGDLEVLSRGWLEHELLAPDEWRAAAAALKELDGAVRSYRAAASAGSARSSAARLAVVGELTSLISAAVDMREIFHGAIEKVQRVLERQRFPLLRDGVEQRGVVERRLDLAPQHHGPVQVLFGVVPFLFVPEVQRADDAVAHVQRHDHR